MRFVVALRSLLGFLVFDSTTANSGSTQAANLLAENGAALDKFGWSVAISGDTAVVGAPWDDDKAWNSGSAYVFHRNGTGWEQTAKLVASDGAAGDNFGHDIAISGDTAVVGAYLNDDGTNTDSGSAYVFVHNHGTGWVQTAKLVPLDGAADDKFGCSVAISNDVAVVGAFGHNGYSGFAYVFNYNGTGWAQMAKLVASDVYVYFGYSVAISGDTAVVGAYGSASALMFEYNGTEWAQTEMLVANDGKANSYFGYSVSIRGDTAVVGAYGDDYKGSYTGSAYVFVHTGTRWLQTAKLVADDGAASDQFGISVAISGDTIVVGAFKDDDKGTDSGSAYVFYHDGTVWKQIAKLVADDEVAYDYFGHDVAISGDMVVVGAYGNYDKGNDSGAGYIYNITTFFTPTNTSSSSKYANIGAYFGFNDATLTANRDCSYQFQFTNSIPGSTIHAAIVSATSCNAMNSSFQIKDGGTIGEIVGPVVTNATVATLTRDVESEIDLADKNSGKVMLNYCLRADLYDNYNPTFSIGTQKVNLHLDITYEDESNFSITSIQTSEFVAVDSNVSATRSVGIRVFKDMCTSGCEIVYADLNGCFSSETDKAKIGDILTLCLKGEDIDVELTGIESASVKAGDTYTSDIVAFDADGSPGTDNFVTKTLTENGEVTLKTLLTPAYYDALEGGANGYLELSGTVLVEYIELNARLLGPFGREHRRQLQYGNQGQDETKAPFSTNIPLNNPDEVPKIAREGSESSSASIDIGADILFSLATIMTRAVGVAAVFFW